MSIGQAALVAEHARRIARVADLVLAASLEVMSGNPSVLDAAVLAAKPVPGQPAAGAEVRAFLDGSGLFTPGVPASVQDPLSFRVGPQVHGAFREFIDILERAVTIELNAMDDNPLVDVASGRMLSNGNFHPMALAIALDALRPAIAHVGQLSDRRMNHLWSSIAELFLGESVGDLIEQGGGLLRYTAATRYSRAAARSRSRRRSTSARSTSASRTTRPTPSLTAQRSEEALDLLQDMLAIELMMAATVAVGVPTGRALPAPIAAAFDAIAARSRAARPAGACRRRPRRRQRGAVRRHPRGGAGRGRPGAMTTGVAGAPTTIRRPGALVAVSVLAAFTANFDLQIVNLALPVIGEAFDVSQSTLAWAVNAYVLPFAVSILAVGRLGDRFGLRPVLTIGGLLFAVGAALSALAPAYGVLLAGRVVQGIGGAALLTIGLASISASFQGPARGRALGLYFAAGATAAVVGPLVGGVLTSLVGWPGMFWVQVPLAVGTAAAAWAILPRAAGGQPPLAGRAGPRAGHDRAARDQRGAPAGRRLGLGVDRGRGRVRGGRPRPRRVRVARADDARARGPPRDPAQPRVRRLDAGRRGRVVRHPVGLGPARRVPPGGARPDADGDGAGPAAVAAAGGADLPARRPRSWPASARRG